MKIINPYTLKFTTYPEKTGSLIPFYSNISFPKKFIIKRFFLLYGKKNFSRADHAHKKCWQIIIPLSGRIKIKIFNKLVKKIFYLDSKNKYYLIIPPYNWINIFFEKNDDSLLTLCNYKYDKNEYISDINLYKKIIK